MGRWEIQDSDERTRRAKTFGAEAESYDDHRPDYPLAAVRWALEPLHEPASPRVLDLAAGTGKLTGVALAAGTHVTAVEPDEAMRAVLHQHHPRVPVLDGTAESIPLPSNSVDAVFVGQAFHWFDPPRAFPEIARVLRLGGVLAAFWYDTDTSVEWVAELDRISRSSASLPRPSRQILPSDPRFTPFEHSVFPHYHLRTAESLTATIGTQSHTLVITPAERTALLARVSAFLQTMPETAAGPFEVPLRTEVIRATRLSSE
ncbi:methyltransferase domain-containing protein [Nocardia sp. ET3-3]|uniref:Methyltransferase domain-containing protein n=2 Tax=Nocardia terrae TaxID=2675851 RepID=A0A7K1UN02_9NOCA|nr:methyltransferase domain-containing protein [Nocardia terrae]